MKYLQVSGTLCVHVRVLNQYCIECRALSCKTNDTLIVVSAIKLEKVEGLTTSQVE